MTEKKLIYLLSKAKRSQSKLAFSILSERNKILEFLKENLLSRAKEILKENQKDLKKMDPKSPKYDRLLLNEKRIKDMVKGIEEIIKLKDPLGKILEKRKLKNGLLLEKISVPLGTVAVIYESRPNVTIEISSICLKAGNAVVLKGGEEAERSNKILVALIKEALEKAGFSKDLVLRIPEKKRDLIKVILKAKEFVDLIIPRGGKGLIDFVRENSLVPTIETGAGVCHIFVDKEADLKMATKIVINAKVSRPSVCNALDTLILHYKISRAFLKELAKEIKNYKVEILADKESYKILKNLNYPFLKRAKATDFGKEFLSLRMSIKTVKNEREAIDFINHYTTGHSEAIITQDKKVAEQFLKEVDAGCVFHNTSTRFSDGGCFGMGGEIGISTQKFCVRGPMGMEAVTTYKWIIRGEGQIRV